MFFSRRWRREKRQSTYLSPERSKSARFAVKPPAKTLDRSWREPWSSQGRGRRQKSLFPRLDGAHGRSTCQSPPWLKSHRLLEGEDVRKSWLFMRSWDSAGGGGGGLGGGGGGGRVYVHKTGWGCTYLYFEMKWSLMPASTVEIDHDRKVFDIDLYPPSDFRIVFVTCFYSFKRENDVTLTYSHITKMFLKY